MPNGFLETGADTLRRALDGDAQAARALVRELSPVVRSRVVRGLWRKGRVAERDPRLEIDDLAQEVFAELFAERGRVLRSWQASRGLSLENFVGLVAERHVASILRTGKRSPWTEDPTEEQALAEAAGPSMADEVLVLSRDLICAILERLREELSPRGLHLFDLLVVQERPIEELVSMTGLNAPALYAWRSRLLRRARALATTLQAIRCGTRQPRSGPRAGERPEEDLAQRVA
jgi:RNA polymerase sigma-70 factor (ECF subfamily)